MFEPIEWVFPIAVTLHNLEEGIWLPFWASNHRDVVPWQMSPTRFRMSASVLTLAAWFITWRYIDSGHEGVWTYLFVAYTFAMFLNVFVPHVPAAILFRCYAPGSITAVMLILPVTTMFLVDTLTKQILPSLTISACVLGLPLALAAVAAVSFGLRLRRGRPFTDNEKSIAHKK